ncbi:ABC transporter ATP-binding protein [Dokdonella sp.]|uniref:ABC transporter ATP-binding protein n=1 Tax=Dokdonella sp. TaxID=2291710 RepID=UPI003C5DEBCD
MLVQAAGLGKAYPKAHRSADRMRALGRLLRGATDADSQYVVRDVDLGVRRGESIAVVGENGAGKSTLLKLITGVLTPTAGSVQVFGKVGALLELGAGFHPEYTGRDNVAMAGALHGLSRDELDSRMQEIVHFADIGNYIDEPVKHYSSGMVVRLGFAIIASLKPDLLITDEVLAVGDESFQKKCVRWMEGYLAEGGTLLLVSHSMYHVQKLCRHALWLSQGSVMQYGDVFDVTQAYLAWHERKQSTAQKAESKASGLEFEIESLEINGQEGKLATVMSMGESLRILLRIRSRDGREPVALFGITRADGTPVYGVSSEMEALPLVQDSSGFFSAEIEFSDISLLPGSYNVLAHALDTEGVRLFDTEERGLTVRGETREFGMVRLAHRWVDAKERSID